MWATHAAPRREVGTRPRGRSRLEQKQSARCFGPLEAAMRSSPKLAQWCEGSAGRFSSWRLCFPTRASSESGAVRLSGKRRAKTAWRGSARVAANDGFSLAGLKRVDRPS